MRFHLASVGSSPNVLELGNFCLEDEERSGRPPQTDEDKIRDLVEKSRSLTVQEMSNVLKIPKTTIHRCLKKWGWCQS